jgi:hypothetical protein
MACHLLVVRIAGVVMHETGETRQSGVFFGLANGIAKHAAPKFGSGRRDKASFGITQLPIDRRQHRLRRAEPFSIAG